MRAHNPEPKKILLVCSRDCDRAEEHLHHAGYRVTKVTDGTAAIERIKHESLNAAVIISTGTEMDLAETVLNLKDINSAVEIVIVVGSHNGEEKNVQTAAIVRALPKTSVVAIGDFAHYLATGSLGRQIERRSRPRNTAGRRKNEHTM